MINKEQLQAKLDEKKRTGKLREERRRELFGGDFLRLFSDYLLLGANLQKLASAENHPLLFDIRCKKHDIPPIYQYLREETNADRQRRMPTCALYNFFGTEWYTPPLRIAVSVQRKDVPVSLAQLRSNRHKPKCLVDIEFFEKIPLVHDSKNRSLRELIPDYEKDGRMSTEELQELGPLKALQDTEKLHLKFLVFEDGSYLTAFLGMGESSPYGLREGNDRFYKYSLDSNMPIEQTSAVMMKGPALDLRGSLIWEDPAVDGSMYGFTSELGVIKQDGANWRKVKVEFPKTPLDVVAEAQKKLGLGFITGKLNALFPAYDSFIRLYYDPLERVHSFGHEKTALLLLKKGLLGLGFESPLNVASDLYQNGCHEVFRMKPIALLLYHFIEIGELERMVQSTAARSWQTAPGECQAQ